MTGHWFLNAQLLTNQQLWIGTEAFTGGRWAITIFNDGTDVGGDEWTPDYLGTTGGVPNSRYMSDITPAAYEVTKEWSGFQRQLLTGLAVTPVTRISPPAMFITLSATSPIQWSVPLGQTIYPAYAIIYYDMTPSGSLGTVDSESLLGLYYDLHTSMGTVTAYTNEIFEITLDVNGVARTQVQ